MPELPDLEAIVAILAPRTLGRTIAEAEVLRPLVVRTLPNGGDAAALLRGREMQRLARRHKSLLAGLSGGLWLAVNPMLAGRLRYGPAPLPRLARDYLALSLSDGMEIVYHDPEAMGKVYVTPQLERIPGYLTWGPEPLDAGFSSEAFLAALQPFRGEVKGVLTRGTCVAGIGNAYADEILFEAGIYPFRAVASLSREERIRLYEALRAVLTRAIDEVRALMGDDPSAIHRGNLRVHHRKGEPCPRCGQPLSEVTGAGRATNFCRRCQPGTLFG